MKKNVRLSYKNKYQEIAADPFNYVDNLKISFRGINLNLFQKFHTIQKTALFGSILCLVLWIIQGFDSSPLQLIIPWFDNLSQILSGHFSWNQIVISYNYYYGKEMHYSAFVIYFLLFYFLSKSWQKAGVKGSKNLAFSFSAMFLAIGVFEWFWILSYGIFQSQPWVYTWELPQLRILIQNTGFTLAGLLTCLYMLTERYHWNGIIQGDRAYYFRMKEILPWIMVALSIASALFWIYYPGYVEPLSVQLWNGETWHNSNLFPQTLYTVNLNPGKIGAINAGEWYWIQNDAIHALNTLVKLIWAATIYFIFRVKPLKNVKV